MASRLIAGRWWSQRQMVADNACAKPPPAVRIRWLVRVHGVPGGADRLSVGDALSPAGCVLGETGQGFVAVSGLGAMRHRGKLVLFLPMRCR